MEREKNIVADVGVIHVYWPVGSMVEKKQELLERGRNLRKIKIGLSESSSVAGSRMVVKSIDGKAEEGKQSFYAHDIWTALAEKIKGAIPEGWIVYGELIGWTPDGKPIQKGYTYNVPEGRADFYIYRIAVVNPQGRMVDLNWDAVKEFAITSGLKHVPELWRGGHDEFDPDAWIDYSFAEDAKQLVNFGYVNQPIALSDPKTVDEGVVIRYDVSYVPYLLKAKSPIFLGWETAELDKGIIDIESEES